MGFKRSEQRMKQIEVQLREGMARNGITGDAADADRHVDHVVRAVRISRVARRELRAARLRERVSQGALPGGVLHGAPQQPADGVLPSVDAREGRAAARRPLPADRRAGVGLGLHGRSRRRHPSGAAVRQRTAAGGRAGASPRHAVSRAPCRPAGTAASPLHVPATTTSAVRSAAATIRRCSERSRSRGAGSATTARTTGRSVRARRPVPWRRASRRSTISSRGRACAATKSSRWPTSARSTRSATTGARRCGRPNAPSARVASCSLRLNARERELAVVHWRWSGTPTAN